MNSPSPWPRKNFGDAKGEGFRGGFIPLIKGYIVSCETKHTEMKKLVI